MKKEIIRKVIHLAGFWNLIFFILVSEFVGEKLAFFVLTLGLLVLLELEFLRVEHKVLSIPHKLNIFRKKEQSHFGGHIFMTLSAIVCFAAFSHIIAVTAFSMMVLGDFFSALVGKRFGKRQFIFNNKTIEGTLAGFISNIIVGFFILRVAVDNVWIILLPMAITASLVEVFTQKLDDNLTVTIFAGACGQILFLFL